MFNAILQNFEQKTALQQDVVTNVEATENDEAPSPTIDELLEKVFAAQNALEQRFATVSVECSDVSYYMKEWQLAVHFNKQITQELSVAAHSHFSHQQDRSCINNFDQATQEIQQLFKISQEMWVTRERLTELKN